MWKFRRRLTVVPLQATSYLTDRYLRFLQGLPSREQGILPGRNGLTIEYGALIFIRPARRERELQNVNDHAEYDYPYLLRLWTDSREHHTLEGGVLGEQRRVSENSWARPRRLSLNPHVLSDVLQPIHEPDRRCLTRFSPLHHCPLRLTSTQQRCSLRRRARSLRLSYTR